MDLIEATGLSRSVFAKPHIRKILVDNGIGHSKADASVPSTPVHKSSQIANKLTGTMLNKLVEKIEVFEPTVVDGAKKQRIHIYYRCVGEIK